MTCLEHFHLVPGHAIVLEANLWSDSIDAVFSGFGQKAQQSMYMIDFNEHFVLYCHFLQVHCTFKRWLHATSEFTRLKKLALTNTYSKHL